MGTHTQFLSYDNPRDVSGVNTWLQRLVPALRDRGIDARVDFLCREPGPNVEWFQRHGIPIRWHAVFGDIRASVRQCLRWLREDLPSVYVPSCMLPAYFAAAEAKQCGVRTVGVLHSDETFYWGLVDEFVAGEERWRLTDVVAVSEYLKRNVQKSAPAGIAVHGIPYGVPVPAFSAKRESGPVRMIYTGRLVEEQKRISEIARAFCAATRRHPGLEAWIVGSGANEPDVREIIASEGMQHRVILKGFAQPSEVYGLLEQCHIHVLLSDYEGLPISLLEAMATGLVPVCLDMRSGIRDVLHHGENGLIVSDRGQPFLDAIAYLIGSPDAWRRMSSAARREIENRFSVDRCIDMWEGLLKETVPARPPRGSPRRTLTLPAPNPKLADRDRRHSPIMLLALFGFRVLRFAVRRFLMVLERLPFGAAVSDCMSSAGDRLWFRVRSFVRKRRKAPAR